MRPVSRQLKQTRMFFSPQRICREIGLCLLLLMFTSSLYAEDLTGEIINVNYRDKVAFIDMGTQSLNVGDIVKVDDNGWIIYLQALSVENGIIRLGCSQNPDYPCQSDQFKQVMVGVIATRVWTKPLIPKAPAPSLTETVNYPGAAFSSTNNPASALPAPAIPLTTSVNKMPIIDPQAMVKPNLAQESIQSLDARLDKMVESNVKLFNALNEMLNEKKTWEVSLQTLKQQYQDALAQNASLTKEGEQLKSIITQSKFDLASTVADREKYKKQAEELAEKVNALKLQLNRLTQIIEEQMNHVSE